MLFVYFAITFLIITPGAVLQPVDFFQDVRFQFLHYATGHGEILGVPPNDVGSYFQYMGRMIEYLSLALLSRNEVISLLLLALAGVGSFALWKTQRNLAVVLPAILVISVFYFSTQTVFIVRNFLFLLPVLSVLIGIGAGHLFYALPRRYGAATLGLVLLAAFGLLLAGDDAGKP